MIKTFLIISATICAALQPGDVAKLLQPMARDHDYQSLSARVNGFLTDVQRSQGTDCSVVSELKECLDGTEIDSKVVVVYGCLVNFIGQLREDVEGGDQHCCDLSPRLYNELVALTNHIGGTISSHCRTRSEADCSGALLVGDCSEVTLAGDHTTCSRSASVCSEPPLSFATANVASGTFALRAPSMIDGQTYDEGEPTATHDQVEIAQVAVLADCGHYLVEGDHGCFFLCG